MQERIKRIYTQQFSLAKGGINTLTSLDRTNLLNQITVYKTDSYKTFQSKSERVGFHIAQIRNRAGMYMHSSTQAYERGKASSFRLDLPEYPADGSSDMPFKLQVSLGIQTRKRFSGCVLETRLRFRALRIMC